MSFSPAPLLFFQWLHVIAGLVWVGGYAVAGYLLPRAMLGRPVPAARAVFDPLNRVAQPLMVAAGLTVLVAGVLRGTVFGPVRSLTAAFDTPYGLTWVLALALTVTLLIHSGRWYRRLPELIWNGDFKRGEARARVDQQGLASLTVFSGIVACMVLMRFGL